MWYKLGPASTSCLYWVQIQSNHIFWKRSLLSSCTYLMLMGSVLETVILLRTFHIIRSNHIQGVCRKILGLLYRKYYKFSDQTTLLQLYLRHHLDYTAPVYMRSSNTMWYSAAWKSTQARLQDVYQLRPGMHAMRRYTIYFAASFSLALMVVPQALHRSFTDFVTFLCTYFCQVNYDTCL